MRHAYQRNSSLGVLGILLIILALLGLGASSSAAVEMRGILTLLLGIVLLGGIGLWYYGLGCYAMAKGYSGVLAALGLFGPLGLLILLLLPDKHKQDMISSRIQR